MAPPAIGGVGRGQRRRRICSDVNAVGMAGKTGGERRYSRRVVLRARIWEGMWRSSSYGRDVDHPVDMLRRVGKAGPAGVDVRVAPDALGGSRGRVAGCGSR